MSKCICKGNWRSIVKKYDDLIGKKFVDAVTDDEYTFFGLVHSDDDFYYGMWAEGKDLRLLSCAASLDGYGFETIE